MQQINTKFGPIFIEANTDKNVPVFDSNDGKVRILDSEKRYMDYFETETLYEMARVNGHTTKEELVLYIKRIENSDTIENLVEKFTDYELITTDWEEVASFMRNFCIDEYATPESLLSNEWINKIGNYYIVISEN